MAGPHEQHLRGLPGEAEEEREEAEPAVHADGEIVGDARGPALLVLRARREGVGIGAVEAGVPVVDLVVPGVPERGGQGEGREAEPADRLAHGAVAHHRAVQRLVSDERAAGEAVADEERPQRQRPRSADAVHDRERPHDDEREVQREPREPGGHRVERVRRQRGPDEAGVVRDRSRVHPLIIAYACHGRVTGGPSLDDLVIHWIVKRTPWRRCRCVARGARARRATRASRAPARRVPRPRRRASRARGRPRRSRAGRRRT